MTEPPVRAIVTLAPNGDDDRGRRSPSASKRTGGRGSVANQAGLQKLADQLDGSATPDGGAPEGGRKGRGAPVANEAGLRSLHEEMRQAGKGRAGRRSRGRHHRLRVGLAIGLVVLLVIVGGGAGYAYYVTHDLHRVEVKGLNAALTTGQESGTENILMVGSTSRCALTVQNPAYGLCSQGVNGVNSDVIMILHADPAHHRLALLSIPA